MRYLMFVDDRESNLVPLIDFFEEHYKGEVVVFGFLNPFKALSAISEISQKFDEKDVFILVSDINMVDMNGFELASKAREMISRAVILFLSGSNMDEEQNLGGILIMKPIELQILEKLISAFI